MRAKDQEWKGKETVNKDLSPYITPSVKTWGDTKTITGPQTDIKDTCACRPTHPSNAQNTQHKLQKLSHSVFPEKKFELIVFSCAQNWYTKQ